MFELLFRAPESGQRCTQDVDGDAEVPSRDVIPGCFLQEHTLVLERQALPSVLLGEGESRIASLVELLL